jgi:hypothetical protein
VLLLGCAAGEAVPDEIDAEVPAPAIDAPLPADGPAQHTTPDAEIDAIEGPCAVDGTECAPTSDPCKRPGRCQGGVCGAITNAADGTVCRQAQDACHIDATCHNGACGAIGTRADGYNYAAGDLHRCCGGSPVQTNTSQHCGVCGISCGSNACVSVGGVWQCSCTASSDCWSNCCSTSAGAPYVCVPSSCGNPAACIACPGGGTCTETTPHYYCHY